MTISTHIAPISSFTDNYIWQLRESDQRHAVVVDPGDAAPVVSALEREGVALSAILITHHHGDHTGGVSGLTARYPGIPVFGPRERIAGITHLVSEGEIIEPPETSLSFRVLEVPGHTRGHVAYYGHGGLFCGDTLFSVGCGRLFEGSPAEMYGSLQKIADLPVETLIYCAHEYTLDNIRFAKRVEPDNPALAERERQAFARIDKDLPTVPSTLAEELATNPFLRSHVPEVIAAAEAYARRKLPNPVDVFATVRRWKDDTD
uniref:Hydroxyacylglutathione hydrolase n=1 Tax=Candidatus Kentrum sp. MB TaxID=2138164 RepID=A0A450XWR6_9GAMM|nr:MAG: hydroxyacylglutathione hydrolase [Candidatus Kentron sp. MB]VFK36024.1 MAG: hydroxyacylglutathione hydrolase [Candidatus Kentron sp. MB]VFK77544.1 MAG: hydroxyacylglutathione hydrolase [Candidatus Kentron sp. MB]